MMSLLAFKKKPKSTRVNRIEGDEYKDFLLHAHFIVNNASEIKIMWKHMTSVSVMKGFIYTHSSSPSLKEIDIKYYAENIHLVNMIHLIDRNNNTCEIYEHEFESFVMTEEELIVNVKGGKNYKLKIK